MWLYTIYARNSVERIICAAGWRKHKEMLMTLRRGAVEVVHDRLSSPCKKGNYGCGRGREP